ncbi:ATP-binding cassette domain-containing protein [Kineococcus indalonis]|uniref:ATP-binding cassette domain-containing protein n=1 Tax=Kineococcus indalonis TaxID=2696566 RepID=UPI0014120EFF|nr:ABC transporter ATP-binding protein [Kineococcus indalonis]NAZ85529.1 ATP-binding cassette domain-containing protein [Kineococcus indalonis]
MAAASPSPSAPAPGDAADLAVEARGLRKAYGGTAVLDGLTFTARRGRVTALLGPNGAGKTTTVACCEGLRRVDSGTLRVLGLDPATGGAQLRPRVGVVLQDGGLPTGAGALEVLRHVAGLHSDPLPVGPLAERLGLLSFARTRVRRLSGGQRQRLALACALVGRPELLFLDEPSAGLDPQARLAVWEVVRQARDAGVAVLLTTHLMEEAERLADDVVVVDHGRVVAAGSPEELTRGAAALVFSAPQGLPTASLASALPAGAVVTETEPGRYLVSGVPADPRTAATVSSWCATHDVLPQGLGAARRTLEDVFLDLTGRTLR